MPIEPYSPDTTLNQGGSLPSPVIPPAEGDQTVTPAVTEGPQPAATPGLKDRVLGTLNAFRSPQDPEANPTGMSTPVIETPAAPEPIVTTLTPAPEPVPSAIPASPPQITISADTSPFGRATEQSTDRFGETPAEPTATPLTPGLAVAEPPPILPAFEPSSTPPDTTPAVPEILQTLAEPAQTTEAPDTVGQTASEPSPEPTTDPEDKKGPLSPKELEQYRKLNERLLDQLQSDDTIANANEGNPSSSFT